MEQSFSLTIKGNDEANGTLLYINSDSSGKNGKRGFNRSESIKLLFFQIFFSGKGCSI